MSAAKTLLLYALLGKPEASYNAGGSVAAASDGILLAEPADFPIEYLHDGARGNPPGATGLLKRGRPSGRSVAFPVKIEGRGAGVAYSASVRPPDLDTLLRISGHSATVDTTAGAEKVTYAPISSGFASGVFEGYTRGQRWPITGAYADMSFVIDGPGFCMFEFALQGLVGVPTDVAAPSVTYNTATEPPKAESLALAIGSWANPVVRKVEFKAGRKISPRADVNGAGHAGFNIGRRAAELVVTVEAAALATFNPYNVRDLGTTLNVSFTQGPASSYNRIRFTAAQAQLVNVEEEKDEEVALWKLTFALTQSSPILDNDYTLEFIR